MLIMKKNYSRLFPVLFLLFLFCRCNNVSNDKTFAGNDGLNRNPSYIHYSKHAKCRMDCRHINETEVLEMLHNGSINYKKSDLSGDECHKKYAVEGYSREHQRLRIIFAPCNSGVTVVTVIDLGNEWQCDCGEGH
jgi:hypothetical protein